MSKKTTQPMQLRIPRDTAAGAALIKKLEMIRSKTGLSINDVANMAVAAGIDIVEIKLGEIHQPDKAAA